MIRMLLVIFGVSAVVFGMLGTRGQITQNRPWHVFWDMKYQPKYKAQSESRFFADGRTMRMPIPQTVAYTAPGYFTDAGKLGDPDPDVLKANESYYNGIGDRSKVGPNGELLPDYWVKNVPQEAIDRAGGWNALLARGQERFNIYCAVCHGTSGGGGQGDAANGIVGRYGMVGIASYHQERLRDLGDGYLFDVISNGKNSMSSYGHQVKVQDRWAIVGYVRALQLAQFANETVIVSAAMPVKMGGAE